MASPTIPHPTKAQEKPAIDPDHAMHTAIERHRTARRQTALQQMQKNIIDLTNKSDRALADFFKRKIDHSSYNCPE